MLTNFRIIFLTVALSCGSAFAKKAEKKNEKKPAAKSLMVDLSKSQVEWTGFKKVGSKHMGHITLKDGTVDIKDGKFSGGKFVFDMKSITNEDLKDSPDYQTKLVSHLKSEDFFNVEKYPDATFEVTGVKEKDGKQMISGNLTMIGKKKPIEFPAEIKIKDGIAEGTATIEVDRTKWGLTYGSGNFFKELVADKIIKDAFELKVKIAAKSK